MEAHPNFDKGSITIVEEEGTDNFGNNNNALEPLKLYVGLMPRSAWPWNLLKNMKTP
jgi:hypothetical protein